MSCMYSDKYIRNALVVATAVLFVGTQVAPSLAASGPILNSRSTTASNGATKEPGIVETTTNAALAALGSAVRPLSHPQALAAAFRSYFAFKVAHPDEVRKP